ncbi:MAG: cupin domain-containing protein [Candidatus Eremiobacteraeota bacterium]|nr:cupin domain-containing protein [Candidatus Eremiobacteraeota bacterium]MBV8720683.1 cupin domain-containing protein [Candidatus Eremiobacteraeota bacterium]
MVTKRLVPYLSALAIVLFASAAYAQYTSPTPPPPVPNAITRQVLQTANFPGDTYQTVQAIATIAPGASTPNHTHPGVEVGYVLDGNLDLYVAGQPVKHLKAGDSFVNPDGVAHWGKNTNADRPAKILSIYVVDKSKPLASNVP